MKRMERFIDWLAKRQWTEVIELRQWQLRKSRYITPGVYEYETEGWENREVDRLDGGHGTTYFLHQEIIVPQEWQAEEAALLYHGRGEGLLRIDGRSYHGLDRNHWFIPLPAGSAGKSLTLDIELYDPVPEPEDPLNRQANIQAPVQGISLSLAGVNQPVYSLLHTVKIAHEAAVLLPVDDMRRLRMELALAQTMDLLYMEPARLAAEGAVRQAERGLQQAVSAEKPPGQQNGTMHMVGQSHIDIAWLWPVRETVRKVSRTFSTVCTLMDKYPDFRYSQSQPQLYAFAKEYDPQLYARIQARVAEGRWELVGGMWVEPDLNLPGGESLVRQMLYGQGFYEQEFGKRSRIEWLPDTFGYCASLPQLLKQAGIDYFMTTKLGWNDTNVFPHTLFQWVGIDGTSIVAYQNHGVNEHTHPRDVQEHWQSYEQKGQHDELMLLYGHGDGGGGVTHEMVEYIGRTGLAAGQPTSRFSAAADFFAGIDEQQPQLPKWHGDLYLELHRGTFTTHARNKRSNRKAEVLYRQAEIWSRLAGGEGAAGQADSILREGWKLLLLNQFHDIIPGTSIPEVYETSTEEYGHIFRLGQQVLDSSLSALAAQVHTDGEGTPYVVFNSLGWERSGMIYLEGDHSLTSAKAFDEAGLLDSEVWPADELGERYTLAVRVSGIPAFGCRTFWLRDAAGNLVQQDEIRDSAPFPDSWETDFYILEFNEQGEISRWLDKSADRELIPAGQNANQLQFFHDTPPLWDAWDLDSRYEQQPAGAAILLDKQVITRGSVLISLKFRWQLNASVIEQEIVLPRHGRRVDFRTRVLWNEEHKLLKVAFPVDVVTTKATYEIPFGALERPTHRNTSWEQAQYEVCGHRWADLSENDYGVSLLNDCKYGYDIHDGVIRLSLLRAPSWPDKNADRGEHFFTYSLYPHSGDWGKGQVVKEAADLNEPLLAVQQHPHPGIHPDTHAWLGFRSEHVLLDTIKSAEDGSGTIIRLYESAGRRGTATIDWLAEEIRASSADLLEGETGTLEAQDGILKLSFRPYEVKTIKIHDKHQAQEA
ncbi:alpha-mannosidase [Paenibacillus donghaensis]|uniref:alpha-mannosidase n=1 Tax=Paenibacillus donghaensis TaxID=414771 RepID=A0A2Z2KNL8_9BACL|nr:alpha-mannosidase [Paenibacillus donghaensis]ASA24209.1 alpha-mannosidase [Paenibacillus donghaensis]